MEEYNKMSIKDLIGRGGISKKPRSSNLELYRIISMMVIVAHHYVVNSGLLTTMSNSPLSANTIYLYLFGMWGKMGINCFLLITGYFMCFSKITFRKFLKLYVWIITYNILINAIFIITGYAKPSLNLVFSIFPFKSIQGDFVASFLIWWLFIPFLNLLINNCTKKQHLILITLSVSVFSLYPLIPVFELVNNPICWYSTLYFVSSYIRKYQNDIPYCHSMKFWAVVSIISILISMMSVVSLLYVFNGKYAFWFPYYMVVDSNKPLALLVAVSTFMFFRNLRIPQSKFINIAGGASFGVLLIHANSNEMRHWLWEDTVNCIGSYDMPLLRLIIYSNLIVLAIYVICATTDYIRLKIIEEPLFRLIDK